MKLPTHEATTAQIGAIYPFASSASLPVNGVLVGRDVFGGLFVHDPFDLYRAGVITNPNMMVFGQIGRGKSALMKTYLYRQAAFGRRVMVLDPKGEYGPLARALGTEPIRFAPGGNVRINPLVGTNMRTENNAVRQVDVVVGIAAACLARTLRPTEHAALESALFEAMSKSSTPTLAQVVDQLLFPSLERARSLGSAIEEIRIDGRDVALELRRLVSGDQHGMFDGTGIEGARLNAPVVVLDLSALYRSPSLGALMTCVAAALENTWRNSTTQTILVIDEAWAVLSNLGAAQFFQSSWKLARSNGVANIAVLHRISDLAATSDAGTRGTKLAEGLLSDCETIVSYAQSAAEVEGASRVLGLDGIETRLLTRLRRGVALWRVGERPFVVEHRLAPGERELVFTDAHLFGNE